MKVCGESGDRRSQDATTECRKEWYMPGALMYHYEVNLIISKNVIGMCIET